MSKRIELLPLPEMKERVVPREPYDSLYRWVLKKRREVGFFSGLEFFKRTNTRDIILVSRHWPHQLCWTWFLSLNIPRKGFDDARKWLSYGSISGGHAWFRVKGYGVTLHWQGSQWMPALGRWEKEAREWVEAQGVSTKGWRDELHG